MLKKKKHPLYYPKDEKEILFFFVFNSLLENEKNYDLYYILVTCVIFIFLLPTFQKSNITLKNITEITNVYPDSGVAALIFGEKRVANKSKDATGVRVDWA